MPDVFKVEFKFSLDQPVRTPFTFGIVQMLGYDAAGPLYYVKTKEANQWWKEKELSAK